MSNVSQTQGRPSVRKEWIAPELRRLMASEAELGGSLGPDSEGVS
jgi:hypothetical protein